MSRAAISALLILLIFFFVVAGAGFRQKVKKMMQFVQQKCRKIDVPLHPDSKVDYIKLYNGVQMPTLGYGVFLVSPEEFVKYLIETYG